MCISNQNMLIQKKYTGALLFRVRRGNTNQFFTKFQFLKILASLSYLIISYQNYNFKINPKLLFSKVLFSVKSMPSVEFKRENLLKRGTRQTNNLSKLQREEEEVVGSI